MPDYTQDDVGHWLRNNQDKKGTPDWDTMTKAWDQFGTAQPAEPAPQRFDFNRDPALVRADIAAIPDEQMRSKMLDAFGDAYVANERAQPMGTVGKLFHAFTGVTPQTVVDVGRSLVRGMPFGTWADELNAKTAELLGQSSYDEALAYQRAKDRAFTQASPIVNAATQLTGGIASAPATMLRGGSIATNLLGNAGINTALGGVAGAGEAERPEDRASGAAWGAGSAAALSGAFAPLQAAGMRYSRFTPEVQAAADQLAVKTPFFVRAEDPMVRAAGRQAAQGAPGSTLAQAWEDAYRGTQQAGGEIVQRATGAGTAEAPRIAGNAVREGVTSARDAARADMRQLAGVTNAVMPPGFRGDPSELRTALANITAGRTEAGLPPTPGFLGNVQSHVDMPGGVSWRGSNVFNTELGRQAGLPEGRKVSQEVFSDLYRANQGETRPRFVEEAAGPIARQTFERMTEGQRGLGDLRRTLNEALGTRDPAALTSMLADAATVRGGGPRLNTLEAVLAQLDPQQREQLGGGVLATYMNRAQSGGNVSAARLASQLNDMAPSARGGAYGGTPGLFPNLTPVGRDVDALATLAQRVGQVAGEGHVGSAKTLGSSMVPQGGLGTAAAGAVLAPALAGLEPTTGAATALAGRSIGKGVANLVTPLLYRHGLPPWLSDAINAVAAGTARAPMR